MSDKKHIDRLFQEKFKDFDATPNDAVWTSIQASLLKQNQKKRRVVPLWWRIAGAASAVIILISFGISFWKTKPSYDTEPSRLVQPSKKVPIKKTSEENQSSTLSKHEMPNKTLVNTKPSNTRLNNQTAPQPILKIRSKKESTSTVAQPNVSVISKSENKYKTAVVASKRNNKNPSVDKTTGLATITNQSVSQDNVDLNQGGNTLVVKKTDGIEDTFTSENAIAETPTQNKASLKDAIAENTESNKEKEESKPMKRWRIKPNIAPVYFGSLGNGSPINAEFNENSKSTDVQMSYGIAGSYAISKRISVRVGINSVNLNQTTGNVIAFPSVASISSVNQNPNLQTNAINYSDEMPNITLMSGDVLERASSPEIFNTKTPSVMDQRFGFIEIPVELEYRLLDHSFGINVIGGWSTLFLNTNEIYADIDGSSTLIGEANNINNTSFSANFGIGLDYSFSDSWQVHLEPILKYQFNTFTNTSNSFNPYFFGVYTGFSFKF